MKIKSFAKINLCLKVFKNDGESKHKIDSVLYLYKKLFDTISIKKDKAFSITYFLKNKEIKIEKCLVKRTIKYLKEKHNLDCNYKIVIKKRIPLGSGLGGGSSNAAAIIHFLIENKNINLDLRDIALNLGSDIPFFLSGYKVARVRNYGEFVSPIFDWEPKITLHTFDVSCSTEKIFKMLDDDRLYKSSVNVDQIIKANIYKQHLNVVYNDLTKYIIQSDKQLEEHYKSFGENAWFTGAGSTIVTSKE